VVADRRGHGPALVDADDPGPDLLRGERLADQARPLGRGVLQDETRAITKNRQPGRCCDQGCAAPGQPVMVEMPKLR